MARRIHSDHGGPITDPIREMLKRPKCDGIIFDCETDRYAESVRSAALMLKKREQYSYRTKRNHQKLMVYKANADPWFMHGPMLVKIAAKADD